MLADPITLTYYTVDEHRDSGDLRGFDRREFPELGVSYVSAFDAQRAGDAVFTRVEALYRKRVADFDPMREPAAVKRRWEDPTRAACFAETRITDARVEWVNTSSRWGEEWTGTMTLTVEHRHRWREVEMRTQIGKDGTTTITHALGKALPWTAWSRTSEGGGVYVPPVVRLVVRWAKLTLAADRSAVEAWADGCAAEVFGV